MAFGMTQMVFQTDLQGYSNCLLYGLDRMIQWGQPNTEYKRLHINVTISFTDHVFHSSLALVSSCMIHINNYCLYCFRT